MLKLLSNNNSHPLPYTYTTMVMLCQYAWFNGIDPKNMRETDGVVEGAENCVQGESFRGKPEWECD
jgi:hypothetical protein